MTYGKEGATGSIRTVSSLFDCCCIDNKADTSNVMSSIFVVTAHLLLYCFTIRSQSCLLLSFVDCYDYVHVLAIVSIDRWQTKTPYFSTLSRWYVSLEICFYYNSLRDDQYQNETEINKFDWLFDRAFFLFEFLPPTRCVTNRNEMIKGDGEKERKKAKNALDILLFASIPNKGNHLKLGITCCVHYQPLDEMPTHRSSSWLCSQCRYSTETNNYN